MKTVKTGKDILDNIKDSISINIDSISSEELLEIIKYIESEKVLDTSNH